MDDTATTSTSLRLGIPLIFLAALSTAAILTGIRNNRLASSTPTSKISSAAAGHIKVRGFLISDEPPLISPYSNMRCHAYIISIYHYVIYGWLRTYCSIIINFNNIRIIDTHGNSIELEISLLDHTLTPTSIKKIPPWGHWTSEAIKTLNSLRLEKIGNHKPKCIPLFYSKIEETAIPLNQEIEITGEAINKGGRLIIRDSKIFPMRISPTNYRHSTTLVRKILTILAIGCGCFLLAIALHPITMGKAIVTAIICIMLALFVPRYLK
jgi:hypothetical protein